MLDRMFASLRAWAGAFAHASPGGRVEELDGVTAMLMPSLPDRSIANSVVYDDVQALAGALDRVAALYDEAGVNAWTVWAHESDREAGHVLAAAGNVLDTSPMAMVHDLSGLEPPPEGVLDLVDRPRPPDMVQVLVESYGWAEFGDALVRWAESYHPYVARLDGQPAACLAIVDADGDAAVTFVGTVPAARGRGLATALMQRALLDARERGNEVSTLQSTRMGHPIYSRLGYRDLGRLNMWERRRPSAAA